MRNAGQDDNGQPPPDEESAGAATKTRRGPVAKRLRITASVLGLLGAILSIAVPFLPVVHDITTLEWPTAQGTRAVSAPLVRYSPIELNASVPCQTVRSLDARTQDQALVLGTNPPNSEYGKLTGMTLQVTGGQLTLLSKGRQLGTTPMPSGDCSISIHSDASSTTAGVGNQPLADIHGQDRRPQLTGIYSDIDEQQDPTRGLSFSAQVDNRWSTQGTMLKFVAMGVAVLCFIGSVITLRKLDVRAGRRPPKLAPPGWWKPTLRDGAVFAALGIWWLIGAMTSDDGYFLTMARARDEAGYLSNYFRWFAVPEAPFAWFAEFYSVWVQFSTAIPWVRLPTLLMGLASWMLISREVLPRLGQQVRRSNAAGWAAAAVFLAFWLPYNNGLRPEPIVVLFSLLALAAVERAVATRRLMPAAVGLVGAALALGANPHGLVAVLPYVAALKPLIRLVRLRIQEFGWLPVLAPIAASGFVILNLVFWDQTWKAVLEATKLRSDIGPSHSWYEEFQRYSLLFSQSADGSLTRRFPVLLVILCLIACVVVLLRRGHIRGAALGPSRRLLGVTAMSFVVLMLVPTKWTHHFGIFAAVGGALAALTALATSGSVLRSRRNRAAFFAGLMLILAFATTGLNAWWYVSGWGIPWFNKPPSYHGYEASTFLLIIAGIALAVAFIEHLRTDEHNPTVVDVRQQEKRSRALRLGTAPLSLICALLVLGELALFGKAIEEQWGSYSLGGDNLQTLAGGSQCGLSDSVYVERNPLAGMLPVSQRQPTAPAPGTEVPERNAEEENPRQYLGARMEGFRRGGFPPGDGSESFEKDWQPPYGFGTDKAPVWGSYDPKGLATGELRTQWYDLPQRAIDQAVPVVLSFAGMDDSVQVEFGRDTEQGFEVMERRPVNTTQVC